MTANPIPNMHLRPGPDRGATGPHGGGTRAVVMGREGVVSSNHWLASQEAINVLQRGGNAFDAAVCAAAVVSVAEPYMSGIGGSGGAVCFEGSSGECYALDFHAFAPAGVNKSRWTDQSALVDDAAAALVPGVAAGWSTINERFGALSFGDVMQPAIDAAANGVPASILCADQIGKNAERLHRNQAARRVFFSDDRPLRPGELLVQGQLAESLRLLAVHGASGLYDGPLTDAFVKGCAREGGVISRDDLMQAQEVPWTGTASTTYRGLTIHTLPPPYTSFQLLETLRILEAFDLQTINFQSGDHLHLVIEAIKISREDRINFAISDSSDYGRLLSDDHIAQSRGRIRINTATRGGGDRFEESIVRAPQHTTHLVAADRRGNFISLTQTLGWYFGSALMVGETGILLNDMLYFADLSPESPAAIRGGAKIASPIAPVIATNQTEPFLAVGTPGGFGIAQTTMQMLSNVIDFGCNPQTAIEAPRVRADEGFYVAVESRLPSESIDDLSARGHDCHDVGNWMYESDPEFGRSDIGRGSMVVRDPATGALLAGADPRGDGFATGL